MQQLLSAGGVLTLRRWPHVRDDQLRAWDAADEYILNHLQQEALQAIVILNDAHGALSTCLHAWQPVIWTDSWMSLKAAQVNRQLNGLRGYPLCIPSTQELTGVFDIAVIRIPKTTALLEDQLIRLKPHLHDNSRIVAGAMVKHLQKSAFTVFERYIGPVTTSLAKKKARLLFVKNSPTTRAVPSSFPTRFSDPDLNFELINLANVYSRERLDHGARFLMQQYGQIPVSTRVIDLACGNGVLGIRLQQIQPAARLTFIDESWQAVASAKASYKACFKDGHAGSEAPRFLVSDALEYQEDNAADLILCNPPFHQQHALGERIAESMFAGMKRCLCSAGQGWIVANRHLNYTIRLERLFGNCRVVASNRRFSVYKVVKR